MTLGVNKPLRSLFASNSSVSFLGETFVIFICWITLPADLKNWDFEKKKKKKKLPDTIEKMLVFGNVKDYWKKIIISKHCST